MSAMEQTVIGRNRQTSILRGKTFPIRPPIQVRPMPRIVVDRAGGTSTYGKPTVVSVARMSFIDPPAPTARVMRRTSLFETREDPCDRALADAIQQARAAR